LSTTTTWWGSPALLRPPVHHGSHRSLLSDVEPGEGAASSRVDAIVVPTGRDAAHLEKAIGLAGALDTTLLLLCSRWSDSGKAAKLAMRAGVDAAAVNVDGLRAGIVPSFETTDLLARTRFERRTDTSMKRNLGLVVARLAGWERIVFLDDDITVAEPEDLRTAVRLLDSFDGVGLANGGYPDNSVVCHAHRETGGSQDTFIGGGALAVGSSAMSSFFPNVYNEDWFFLLDETRLRRSAVTGLAVQQPYDPFANERRARSEEFGDCLAEGVFSLLDRGGSVKDADTDFWDRFLRGRLALIGTIIDRIDGVDKDVAARRRMLAALKAARGRAQLITPRLCVDYLEAWHRDCLMWRDHVDALLCAHRPKAVRGGRAERRDLKQVLAELGLDGRTEYARSAA
jgi:hypothetical protein